MRIQDLRITGFKSFVDPVSVRVEAGLTGVVGPNGCGKSNLLEAIRWGMGASSARALRGGEMDDVIFAGTDARPARDIAEVTLVLDNSDHSAPPAFNDSEIIEVIRRIRRGTGSSYRVNGREARARDVQLLFADASTGANSPSLVRQGQISELIAAKPENRRRILEEAAGIAGLHARRQEAEGKLKQAEANLEKLSEILSHMQGQLDHLRKQARQAERYRAVATEIRGLETFILAARLKDALSLVKDAESAAREADSIIGRLTIAASASARDADMAEAAMNPAREEQAVAEALIRRLDGRRQEIERDLAGARAALATAEADIVRIRSAADRESALLRDAEDGLARIADDIATLPKDDEDQTDLNVAMARSKESDAAREEAERELSEAKGKIAASQATLAALRQALADAETRARRMADATGRAEAELARSVAAGPSPDAVQVARNALDEARGAAEKAALDADSAAAEAEAADIADHTARNAAQSASTALARLQAEIQGLEAVTRRSAGADSTYPKALDQTRAAPGFEKALAAALGDDLSAALDARAPAHWAGADAVAPHWPGSVEPLSSHVEAPPALGTRLKFVGVTTRSIAEGLAVALPIGARLVTRDGDLWRWDGFVRRSDAASPMAAILEQRNRLAALSQDLAGAKETAAALASNAAAARSAAEKARSLARAARGQVPLAMNAVGRARDVLSAAEAAAARADTARQAAETVLVQARADEEDAARAVDDAARALANAPEPEEIGSLAMRQTRAEAARQSAANARAEASRLLGERDQRVARRESLLHDHAMWTRRREDAVSRLRHLEAEAFDAESRREGARSAPGALALRRQSLLDEVPRAEARKRAADDGLAIAETSLRTTREAARAAEQALVEARETRAAVYARLDVARARAEDLIEEARRALDIEPSALEESARTALGDGHDGLSLEDAERRVERLKRERDAMGGVNLRAAEETTEQEARLEALSSEGADLTAAIARLRAAVAEINGEGRERLLAAFDVVHGHFRALFETLFEGGSAELRLTLGDDPLAGGLEIYACPPGKRLQAMSLLSGGEQALTAAALIFAVFLSNPSPICVLDEVDAPLDDSNVDRFCRLLDEMRKRTETRFLVITHHPVTMARMDRLYGVTMVERGVSQLVAVDLQRAEEMVSGDLAAAIA